MTITAKRIRKRRWKRGGGLETVVDFTANVMLLLGGLIACALLLLFSWWGLLATISTMLGTFVQWLLLKCLAEHLRLQKKIAGYEFEGEISGPKEETLWACANCGQILHSDNRCDGCGAQIDLNDAEQ